MGNGRLRVGAHVLTLISRETSVSQPWEPQNCQGAQAEGPGLCRPPAHLHKLHTKHLGW